METNKDCYKRVKQLLKEKDATLIAHFYTSPEIQRLADESGGFIGDSLAMAEYGAKCTAKILVIAGVKFMGETAKIFTPQKTVLMPTLNANCSLDLCCPVAKFAKFCTKHPDREVVVYCNTSAEVKALADWVVTSRNAIDIVKHLQQKGEKIIWATDRYLGGYIQQQTGADMLIWQGSCTVHEKFKAKGILKLKNIYPDAAVLVHPESPTAVTKLADVVGSTSELLDASKSLPNKTFIVATDGGILYKMQQKSPDKTFIMAPTSGNGATCKSCAYCPWMAMNTVARVETALLNNKDEVIVADEIMQQALIPLQKMLNFKMISK